MDLSHYIGIPYKWLGYSRAGTYCYGLVWMVQREVFGRKLPRHEDLARGTRQGVFNPEEWGGIDAPVPIPMEHAKAGDVLRMQGVHKGKLTKWHVGVFADRGHVLHIEGDLGAIMERVGSPRFQWRPLQAYGWTT